MLYRSGPRHQVMGVGCTILCLAFVSPASAADRYWTAATGGYADATRWGGTIPGAGDNAFVNNSGIVQIGASDPVWNVGDLRAAETAGSMGSYVQSGGTVTASGWTRLGFGAGSTGNITLSGGTLNLNNRFYVGAKDGNQASGGNGVLTITGGILNQGTGNPESVTIGARNTGDYGFANTTGSVLQSGGTFNVAGQLFLGNGDAGNGTVAATYGLSGTGQLNPGNWFVLGRGGSTGVINMTGGEITKTGSGSSIILGINSTGKGTINQSGGTFTNTVSPTWFGENDGTGLWNLDGGNAVLGKVYLAHGVTSTGEINLNGGVLSALHFDPALADPSTPFHSWIHFNGGTLKARASDTNFLPISVTKAEIRAGGAVIDSNGFNVTFDRGFTSNGTGGGLLKKGSGTMHLRGQSTFSGSTSVTMGALVLNGGINAAAPAQVYNDTIGIFSCGSLILSSTARMRAEIDSRVSLADKVIVSGNVNLGGSLLETSDLGKVALPPGTKFKLIEYSGTLSGAFSNAANSSQIIVGQNTFILNYNDASAVTLTIPGGSGFEAWASANISSPADRGPMADPDQDGRVNVMEFALDGNPMSATNDGKMISGTVNVPEGRVTTLTIPVRKGAVFTGDGPLISQVIDGVIYIVEASTDLVDFNNVPVDVLDDAMPGVKPDLSAGWEYRSFQVVPDPANPHPKEFMRVRVATP